MRERKNGARMKGSIFKFAFVAALYAFQYEIEFFGSKEHLKIDA